MKKVFVFCIGGTGLRVMKSIIMLMAGGLSTEGFMVVPIVIDPHLDLEEKKKLHELIESYQNIYNRSINNGTSKMNPLSGFFNSEIQTIDDLHKAATATTAVKGSNASFRSFINAAALRPDDINNFLVETMFSSKCMNNSLSVGFKGNPNVGTVALGNMIEGADWFSAFKMHCEQNDRVFIISSIFGGTGASGYPLMEKKIRQADNEPAVKEAVMGAVTVLPYYGLKDPKATGSDIDSANFYTKTKSALSYYQGHVLSDYLYYVGEKSLKQVYENDESNQPDAANFIELVAASAFFDFLKREKPTNQQFMTRAIEDDVTSLDIKSMGPGYTNMVKSTADFMIMKHLINTLPGESCFPLKQTRGFNDSFYQDAPFKSLIDFSDKFGVWYDELSQNRRAYAPLHTGTQNNMSGFIVGTNLDAQDDSYYLLEMIKASNKEKTKEHSNKFRFFLQFAYEAINKYTSKINK